MRLVLLAVWSVLLAGFFGGGARSGVVQADPIVGSWKIVSSDATQEKAFGSVRVTATGPGTYVAVALERTYFHIAKSCLGEPCTGAPISGGWTYPYNEAVFAAGEQVWELHQTRVYANGARDYSGQGTFFFCVEDDEGKSLHTCKRTAERAVWELRADGRHLYYNVGAQLAHGLVRGGSSATGPSALRVQAFAASGLVPGIVRLPFSVTDASGRATVYVRVYVAGKVYPTGGTRSAKGERQTMGISLPLDAAGARRFCVYAKNTAGEVSSTACAALTLSGKEETVVPIPKVRAYPASGKAGSRIKLRWWASDNSGRATFTVTVYRNKTTLASRTWKNVSAKAAGETHFTHWEAPAGIKPPLRFCVLARNAADSKHTSCATITITQ